MFLVLVVKKSYGSFMFILCGIGLAYPLFIIIRRFWRTYIKESDEAANLSAPHLIIDPNKKEYENISNIAGGICLISLFSLIFLVSEKSIDGNFWEGENPLAVTIFLVHAVSLLVALWYYGESKGYNGICCAPLFFLGVVGLGILLSLENKTKYHMSDNIRVLPGERN